MQAGVFTSQLYILRRLGFAAIALVVINCFNKNSSHYEMGTKAPKTGVQWGLIF